MEAEDVTVGGWYSSADISPSSDFREAITTPAYENPLELIDYRVSIERLKVIIARVKRRIQRNPKGHHAIKIFYAFLVAQSRMLEDLNHPKFHVPVAWDKRTGLPSHPSLAADVRTYVKIFKPEWPLSALLLSSSSWEPLAFQNRQNVALGRGFRTGAVCFDYLLNTVLSFENDCLMMKQFIGVQQANDPGHPGKYFKTVRPSKSAENCFVIFESTSVLKKGSRFVNKPVSQKEDDQFRKNEFVKLMEDIAMRI